MKKIFLVLCCLILVLSFCACSGGDSKGESDEYSLENMLQDAENVDIRAFLKAAEDNPVKARNDYESHTCKISGGYVEEIKNGYIIVGLAQVDLSGSMPVWHYDLGDSGLGTIYCILSDDEIAELSTGDQVTIVGVLDMVAVQSIKSGPINMSGGGLYSLMTPCHIAD